jgi:hypothetical protein
VWCAVCFQEQLDQLLAKPKAGKDSKAEVHFLFAKRITWVMFSMQTKSEAKDGKASDAKSETKADEKATSSSAAASSSSSSSASTNKAPEPSSAVLAAQSTVRFCLEFAHTFMRYVVCCLGVVQFRFAMPVPWFLLLEQ